MFIYIIKDLQSKWTSIWKVIELNDEFYYNANNKYEWTGKLTSIIIGNR